MLDDTTSQEDMRDQQFAAGTLVYDVNGDKVGIVTEQGVQGDNLVLQKGLFFPHDYYVPLRTIMHADADGIYLNVTKDDVTNQSFDNAATGITLESASGYSDTATSHLATEHEAFGNRVAEGVASNTEYMGQLVDYEIGRPDAPVREGEMRVSVSEEQLGISKQQREMDRAGNHDDVIEEQQTLNVPATHEELDVERVPVRGHAIDVAPDAFTERDFDIPLRGEEVVAKKEARLAEEVRLRKQQVTENQHVSDTVRKERVRIEGGGIDEGESDVPPSSDAAAYEQNADNVQPRHDI